MADTLPLNFPIPAEGSIVSYNWSDTLNGLGYITFYPTITDNSTAENILSPEIIQGEAYISASGTVDTTFSSSTFNTPKTIKGDAYISGALYQNSGANTTITATFYKYSGGQSAISSAIATETWVAGGNRNLYFNFRIPLTETHFKIGDYLQLKLSVTSTGNLGVVAVSPNASGYFSGVADTTMYLSVPFKVAI